jgi:hypothetical protein
MSQITITQTLLLPKKISQSPRTNRCLIDLPNTIKAIEEKYGIKVNEVKHRQSKKRNHYCGCYYSVRNIITLSFSNWDKKALSVVLHEFAHAIQHLIFSETLTPRRSSGRRVIHNYAFFELVKEMYNDFDCLEEGISIEYKSGRAILAQG